MTEELDPETIAEYSAIVDACRPHLVGHGSGIQSAALAELIAIWLCGHPDILRAGLLHTLTELIRNLVVPCELELYDGGHHPQNKGLKDGGMIF